MAYTLHDTPAVTARVEADLLAAEEAVVEADPGLRSLVLTGGFARGEGAVLDGRPQNDYDLVAVRGRGRPTVTYRELAARLERRLGLHVDLAPVAAWRLPHVQRSIFWYETVLRGQVLWGEDLLGRIPVRDAAALDRSEGLRLLANRAAGLLLATSSDDAAWRRIQCSKALLAALDAYLLAAGAFAPSQTERWEELQQLRREGRAPPALAGPLDWFDWAYRVKVDPGQAPARDEAAAWRQARLAVLRAVPVALRHAGLASLSSYARRGGLVDRAVWWRRSAGLPSARRLAAHPTGRVRVATLRLLADAPDGRVHPESAWACLHGVVRPQRPGSDPIRLLDRLRQATLQ